MRFHILTLFPGMFDSYLSESILKRAIDKKHIAVFLYNIRDFAIDKRKTTDDRPFSGGPGMVMKAEPILKAVTHVQSVIKKKKGKKTKLILFSPGGKLFSNPYAEKLSKEYSDIVMICGRYEGVDARVKKILKTEDISVGNYVLTGGEIPALVVIDAVSRHIKGVLGNILSPEENRVSSHEMYTRPDVFVWKKKKYTVPAILLSGDHKKIDAWKQKKGGFDTKG